MEKVTPPIATISTKTLRNGFSLPVYGLGTSRMGMERAHDSKDIAAIKDAIEHGVTHIDTASLYADGHVEELLGQAIASYAREKLQIVSKVKRDDLRYEDTLRSCDESLARLNTPYLDVLLMHRYDPAYPLKETLKALSELVEMGKVRHIGVSNFNTEHLKEAQSLSKYPIVCNQVHYNLKFREPEREGLLEYCQKQDVLLVAYRPIQRGMLIENPPPILEELSKKYGKTPTQVALNWLMAQPAVTAISKTSTREHLEENLGALGWELEHSDIERLREEYPDQQSISDTVPLA
jgi:diketogulonate reductase-like aldo/keto reductase